MPPPPDPRAAGRGERPAFDPAEVRRDLEGSARARFGDALVDEALASPAFVLAKHYYGLSPPPILQPDGSYRFPEPPTAMLIRRDGAWLAARAGGGFAPVDPAKAAALEAALGEPAFRSEPAYLEPTCTDAGASLLWLKLPGRPTLFRKGACGGTARTERAVFLVLDA